MNKQNQPSIDSLTTKIGGISGYEAPKKYLDTIEDAFFIKLAEENFSKENSFEVPNNYFKNIENNILTKIASKKKHPKVISLKERIIRFIPITAAASVLLFVGLNYVTSKSEKIFFEDISTTDIETWYENDYGNDNTNELFAVLEATDFNENDFLNTTITDTDLEDYLINADTSILINEIQ